jgi:ankyrin repeat protein
MNDRELDERYRHANAADDARPRPAVRQAILEQAARSAHEIQAQRFTRASSLQTARPGQTGLPLRASLRWWRWKVAVPVAAALLVAVILVPTSKLPGPSGSGTTSNTSSRLQQPIAKAPEAQRNSQFDSSPDSNLVPRTEPPGPFPKQATPGQPAQAQSPPPAPSPQLAEQYLRAPRSVNGSRRQPPPDIAGSSDAAINLPTDELAAGGLPARQTPSPAAPPGPSMNVPPIGQEQRITGGLAADAAPGATARSATEARRPALTSEPSDPLTEIQRAAAAGGAEELSALITRYPALLNTPDAQGRTALMLAVLNRQAATATLLLGRGADPNLADREGRTPLEVAEAQGDVAISTALAHAGGRLSRH